MLGSSFSEHRPSEVLKSRFEPISLGDLWQLDFDCPGGNFSESDFETKEPRRKFGSWRLCFGCDEYNVDMFKCGGTCGGRISLCSVDCQKKSWRKHRQMHRCQKF